MFRAHSTSYPTGGLQSIRFTIPYATAYCPPMTDIWFTLVLYHHSLCFSILYQICLIARFGILVWESDINGLISLVPFCFPFLYMVQIVKHRNQVKRSISPNPAIMPKTPVLPGFFDCFTLYVVLCLCVNTLSFDLFAAKIQGWIALYLQVCYCPQTIDK